MTTTLSESDLFQLGLTADWSVDRNDPRNAKYLVPLDNDEDEDIAHCMAESIVVMGCGGDESRYEQALIDSRRMILDPAYEALFTDGVSEAQLAEMMTALVDEVDKGGIASLRLVSDDEVTS